MAPIKNFNRFVREIETTDARIDAYTARLELLVNEYLTDLLEDFKEAGDEDEALAILAAFSPSAFPIELKRHLREVESIYARELELIDGRFDIQSEDRTATRRVSSAEARTIRTELASAFTNAASALALGGLATGRVISRKKIQDDFFNGRLRNIGAQLVTGVAAYRSGMEVRKARESVKQPKFAYVGPIDDKNRPFCAKVLSRDKLFTLKEINALDGDPEAQLTPVFLFGGGWNCRHRWIFAGA